MDFFSSDWHLDHKNILKYDNRPFKDINHMNETIINNYNGVVGNNDNFYFLGDFCFNDDKLEEYLSRLNGNLFFIKGNHDSYKKHVPLFREYGTYLGELTEITIKGQRIVLCHYAMRVYNRSHRGAYHLYAHSHHSLIEDPNSLSFDVGINGPDYGYKPVSFEYVVKRMQKKTYKSIDHHGH